MESIFIVYGKSLMSIQLPLATSSFTNCFCHKLIKED